MKKAVAEGEVSELEVTDHVRRILRAIFATGLYDHPIVRQVPDVESGFAVAKSIAEKSIVLLKNSNHVLPLNPSSVHTVVLIGGHANIGVLTGGGSAQVDSPGGSPVPPPPAGPDPLSEFMRPEWLSDAPLSALRKEFGTGKISYVSGNDLEQAVSAARAADVAIVFAYQWESENLDLPTLNLSADQNRLIESVAAVNAHTVVVLETGSPVTMPWVDKIAGVIEAWYPGIRGAEALAEILTGAVNPSGKLAITFPRSDSDLPHPTLVVPPPASVPHLDAAGGDISKFMSLVAKGLPPFQIYYDEGLKVGYKWYDTGNKPVLFPFGFGLSYTTFAYYQEYRRARGH